MKYKLIAVDIDGTLVNSKSELTPGVRAAVKRAVDAGAVFVVSTGRPLGGVKWLNDILDAELPFITYNGAVVVMSKSQKCLYRCGLPPELCKETLTAGLENRVGVFAWVDGQLYTPDLRPENDIYRRISGFEPVLQRDVAGLSQNGADKVLWCGDPILIAKLQEELCGRFNGVLNCHTSSPPLLEFVNINASKAKAMEKIGELYGISRDEMIAVGDGYNDISMLEYAGLGVAMANAPQAVKDRADYVTLSNDDDGVARVIDKFVFEKE